MSEVTYVTQVTVPICSEKASSVQRIEELSCIGNVTLVTTVTSGVKRESELSCMDSVTFVTTVTVIFSLVTRS